MALTVTVPPWKKGIRPAAVLTAIFVFIDQCTKRWANTMLFDETTGERLPAITLIDGYLELVYYQNPGASFSLFADFAGARWALIAFACIALGFTFFVWRSISPSKPRTATWAYALVTGGALGNLIDRVYIGEVIDFIHMHWNHKYSWPVYNLADVLLLAGAICFLLTMGKEETPHPQTRN